MIKSHRVLPGPGVALQGEYRLAGWPEVSSTGSVRRDHAKGPNARLVWRESRARCLISRPRVPRILHLPPSEERPGPIGVLIRYAFKPHRARTPDRAAPFGPSTWLE